jgi:protein TonB
MDPTPHPNAQRYAPAFAQSVLAKLEQTSDRRVLAGAGVLTRSFPGYRPLPPEWDGVLARVRAAQPPAPQQAALSNDRVLASVKPAYPPLAKQARIQGVVRISVKIGADGKLAASTLISGHPLLVPAALDALKQYTFAPGSDESGVVEVPFRLQE